MTDPLGVTFVSYRRTRAAEVSLLVSAMQTRGIPTWRDTDDLRAEPTEEELRRVLQDPTTAGGVLWITPDVHESAVIGKVEAPLLVKRWDVRDGFFVQPVAAGGLDYAEAAAVAGRHLGVRDLVNWNIHKVRRNPIEVADAVDVARAVLSRRLANIADRWDVDDDIELGLFTRDRIPKDSGLALPLDWAPLFDDRVASEVVWQDSLLPALRDVANAVVREAPGRTVSAQGLAALPALLALGHAFVEPRGVRLVWNQRMRDGGGIQKWALDHSGEPAPVVTDVVAGDATADDVALVVSLNHDTEPAITAGQLAGELPPMRCFVRVRPEVGSDGFLANPAQAADAARRTRDALRTAQRDFPGDGVIHVFLAAPAGYAVLLGQLLNGFGPIQTYENEQSSRIGQYLPAVRL